MSSGTSTPPAPSPKPTFQPPSPTMGGLVQVSATEWCAWTGGQPNITWTSLSTNAKSDPTNVYQYRPGSPAAAQKSTSHRETGIASPFSRTSNLLDFIDEVNIYLKKTGMDTIAYRESKDSPGEMLFVITDYTKFNLADILTNDSTLRSRFDMYDRNNDDSATVWLLASIDASLRKEVTDRVSKSDGFVAHWLQLIACIQSVSFARFDKIKREIEDL